MSNTPSSLPSRISGVNWSVTGAVQTTAQADNGQYARGWEVTYRLDTGHTGTVFVPLASFNEDTVKQAINKQAATLYGVVNLQSGS